MVELEQLKQLISFKKYGTLSKAAEELYISQPALSRSIQKLEKTLGVELFDRKKNKMELNQNGKTVIQYAEKILNLVDQMEEKVNKNKKMKGIIYEKKFNIINGNRDIISNCKFWISETCNN